MLVSLFFGLFLLALVCSLATMFISLWLKDRQRNPPMLGERDIKRAGQLDLQTTTYGTLFFALALQFLTVAAWLKVVPGFWALCATIVIWSITFWLVWRQNSQNFPEMDHGAGCHCWSCLSQAEMSSK